MKGDFSRWDPITGQNLNGVLHQQGRVLLDRDWNDQARLTTDWQDQAGEDIIGPDVMAVPAHQPDAFRVEAALVAGAAVQLQVRPGRGWADGWLAHLPGDPAVTIARTALYAQPPLQDPAGDSGSIDDGVRDAVVFEVWREALNGFQVPDRFIEPALGGPDTTERLHTAMRFRLFRMGPDDTCHSLDLYADEANLGRLRATLEPPQTIGGDCPVEAGGGYVGFEHAFYRVEIAEVDSGEAMFKWSQFNGGLVGRGRREVIGPDIRFVITANSPAITTSGLDTSYLEVVEYDSALGHWRVSYGADVTRNDDVLEVTNERYDNPVPGAPAERLFFRLWNEIRPLTDFPQAANPNELRDGIRLAFDDPAATTYRPGDYWTFHVRAGDITNPETLVDDERPEGIRYRRVPLAELHWNAAADISFEAGEIEDCRDVFQPLTGAKGCCTYSVGDGILSRGDFRSIAEALRHLPASGGQICVLPGLHRANVQITARQHVRITGCGTRSVVVPEPDTTAAPLFRIDGSQHIEIDHLTMLAAGGTGINVDDTAATQVPSHDIHLHHNQIIACEYGIRVAVRNERAGDNDIEIAHNRIGMLDKEGGQTAIFTLADDVRIERNRLVVVPAPDPDDPDDPRDDPDEPGGFFDPCAELGDLVANGPLIYTFVEATLLYLTAVLVAPTVTYQTRGGIQVGGGSERVLIRDNEIIGGAGNGITLGHMPTGDDQGNGEERAVLISRLPQERLRRLQERFISSLYEIAIEGNTIRDMGLSGIGPVAFFHLERIGLIVRIEEIAIHSNHITGCTRQLPEEVPEDMLEDGGFGGIVLVACERATIHSNRIEDNGATHRDPVCGILILYGEQIDLAHNRIVGNGPDPQTDLDGMGRGLRGGIVVAMSFQAALKQLVRAFQQARPTTEPAVKVHSNVVTHPLGQALFVVTMGPVSVVGNHFTAQGADVRTNIYSLLAGTVFIFNLGLSKDLLARLLLKRFKEVGSLNPDTITTGPVTNADAFLEGLQRFAALPNGPVLFANNQTLLDLRAPDLDVVLSSQLLVSLDDVAVVDNQSEVTSLIDFAITNTAVFGITVRVSDNRFQEGITFAFYSLLSFGVMNAAIGNQATHCLLVLGNSAFRVEENNRVLLPTAPCSDSAVGLANTIDVPPQQAIGTLG